MRAWRLFFLIALLLMVALGLALLIALQTEAFWRWSGPRILAVAQDHVGGTILVKDIYGTPFTGLTCRHLILQRPDGKVFQAESLTLRLSLWSLLKQEPVVAELILEHPTFTLYRHSPAPTADNLRPPPPTTPSPAPSFKSLTFSHLTIKDGALVLITPTAVHRWDAPHGAATLTILHPGKPHQTILVRHAALTRPTPQGVFSATGRLSYSSHQLNLASLTLNKDGEALLSLGGLVDLSQGEPDLLLSGEFSPLPGQVIGLLWSPWPPDLPLSGKLTLKGTPAHLQVSASGEVATTFYELDLTLRAPAGRWHYDFQAHFTSLTPPLLNRLRPPSMSPLLLTAPFSAHLHLRGTDLSWPLTNFTATLTCRPFTWRDARLDQVEVTLHHAQGRQELKASLKAQEGLLTVAAAGQLWPSPQGDLRLQADNFPPARAGLAVPDGTCLSGIFTGSFQGPHLHQPHRLRVAGQLQVSGRWGLHPLQELKGRIIWQQPRLEFTATCLRLAGLAADLQGYLESGQLNVQARLQAVPAGGWPWPAALRGRLEAHGRLTGSTTKPHFYLMGQGRALSWPGIKTAAVNFTLSGRGWPPQDGSVELQSDDLATPLGHFSSTHLKAVGQEGRWQVSLTASSRDTAEAALQGTVDLNTRPMAFQLSQCRFHRGALRFQNAAPVRGRLLPGVLIDPASFTLNGGNLKLRGEINAHKSTGSIELQDFPAELLALRGEPLAGKLNAHLTLSGSGTHPLLNGHLTLRQGRWASFTFGTLTTQFSYQADWLRFSGALSEDAVAPRFTWDGRLPVHFSLSPWRLSWGEEELRLAVQGEKASLNLLTLVSREIQAAQGEVQLAALCQGTIKQPRLSGSVRWGEGMITFRQAGLPYRLHPGDIRLSDHCLTIPQITLESGGIATLRGKVTLRGVLPHELDLTARLDHFKALRRGGTEALGSGSLTLTGPWAAPLLKGHLVVPQATFQTVFFKTPGHDDIIVVRRRPSGTQLPANAIHPQELPQVKMAIILETPGGVYVKDKRLEVELAGRITAYKDPHQPAYLAGDLRALQGHVQLHGKTFKVLEGIVHFPGRPKTPILLAGRCAHEVAGVTLFLDVTGPAKKPEVKLSSNPPLPPADIFSYLVFGLPAQALNREQYLTVGQQLANILGGLTAKKIQDFLGPDFPLIGDLTMIAHQEAVGVAKPLTKDLTVSLERKTNPIYRDDLNQLRLEYRLNRYLSIESQLGRRNSGADVLFNIDF